VVLARADFLLYISELSPAPADRGSQVIVYSGKIVWNFKSGAKL
jgi:hypothetical protein